jgi:hypothetical protein
MRGHSIAADVLSAVRHAYQMTAYMEAKDQERITTCVLAHDGAVLLRKEVYGMEQACLLRDMLLPFGFVEHEPGANEPEAGCRMLLKQQAPAAAPRARRMLTSEERWPETPPAPAPSPSSRRRIPRRARAAADPGTDESESKNSHNPTT